MRKPPHPLLRLALFGAVYLTGSFAFQAVALLILLETQPVPGGLGTLTVNNIPASWLAVAGWTGLAFAVALSALFYRWAGDDPLAGLRAAWRDLGRDTLIGLAVGLASMVMVAVVYLAFGWAAWQANAQSGASALGALAWAGAALVPAAAIEEVIFRGYLLRTLERWRGWPLAAIVSSGVFGLAHAANPNVTVLALLNIALAGAAFALALRLTGTLWLPIAYHFMWNYAQGPLLGFPVSGLDFGAPVRAEMIGPALLTGGAFGPEGGLVVTALLLATCAGLGWARPRNP